MNSYIVFLRGINVSGQKLILMDELKAALIAGGFPGSKTYIQSGNLVVKSESTDKQMIVKQVQQIIKGNFGFEVPCLIKKRLEIKKILKKNPFSPESHDPKKLFFIMLYGEPDMKKFQEVDAEKYLPEEFKLEEDIIYLYAAEGAAKSKLSNNFFEAKLKVNATTRNLNTMKKMLELSENN